MGFYINRFSFCGAFAETNVHVLLCTLKYTFEYWEQAETVAGKLKIDYTFAKLNKENTSHRL
jgi:hypothetical protein